MLPRFFSPSMASGALPEQLATGMIRGSSARAVADGARGLAARPDSRDLLPTIDVPVLVIVGEHDALTPPADSQLLAEGIPRARLVTIDQAGHMSNLENPEAVNSALLAFLYSYETSTV
jgi:3-oxoadipate enol-lactonase